MIEFDVETTGVQWYVNHVFLAQFGYAGEPEIEVLKFPDDRERIQNWLDRDDDFEAFNGKFDLHFLKKEGFRIPDESRWHDAMVLAHVLDERRSSFALKKVAESMYGPAERDPEVALKAWMKAEKKRRSDEAKAWGKTHPDEPPMEWHLPTYQEVPWEIMEPYAKQDIVLTGRIGNDLRRTIAVAPDLQAVYELERGTMAALFAMEERGWPMDRAAAFRLELASAAKLDELERHARDLAGKSNFNPRSTKQVEEALRRRGANLAYVQKSEKSGELSFDEDNLKRVDDPLAAAILAYRGEMKMHGTYVTPLLHPHDSHGIHFEPFLNENGLLYPSYKQVGARHGRISSADPNVQNWPRDDLRLRYLMHAPPGMKIVAVDLSSIELVLLAAFAGEGKFLEYVKAGRAKELHELTARMTGLTGRQRATGFETPRQQGKKMNYLQVYGGGVRTIQSSFTVDRSRAYEILDKYRATYPEIGQLNRVIEWTLEDRGYIKSPWGRRHRVKDRRYVNREAYKFINYLISGTAADLFKESMVRMHREGIPMIGNVHDEVLALVPEADAEEAQHAMIEALTDHPRITSIVPLSADGAIVDRWSDAKQPGYLPDHEKS